MNGAWRDSALGSPWFLRNQILSLVRALIPDLILIPVLDLVPNLLRAPILLLLLHLQQP